MKKILVEAYLAKNLGDDLFLHILFSRYKNQNVQWTIKTFNKQYLNIFKNFNQVNVIVESKLKKIPRKISHFRNLTYYTEAKKYDALVMIGGSIFSQEEYWEYQLEYNKQKIKAFKGFEKKVFILGANFGPYYDEGFKQNYNEIFNICDDVCFRDSKSYNLFNGKNIRQASDIIFLLESKERVKEKNKIGLSLIDLNERIGLKKYSYTYQNKMIEIVNNITKSGKEAVLFSFCEFQGDFRFAKEIKKLAANSESVKIINYDGNIETFLEEFSSVESIIGVRFHSIILSQIFGLGVYSIIYSEKTENILNDMELKKYSTKFQQLEESHVNDILIAANKNKINNLDKLKLKAEEQFSKLDIFIGTSSV